MQMADWQQKFDEVQQTKDFYRRTSWMQGLIIALIAMVALGIVIGMWWHRRKVRKLSFRLDEDTRRISELRTNIEQLEKSGAENGQEMERMKKELENRMERISGTLLIGTQMFSQLQQRQCIAEVTATPVHRRGYGQGAAVLSGLLRPTAPEALAGVGTKIQRTLHRAVHLPHHAGRPALRRRGHCHRPQCETHLRPQHALKDQRSGEVVSHSEYRRRDKLCKKKHVVLL